MQPLELYDARRYRKRFHSERLFGTRGTKSTRLRALHRVGQDPLGAPTKMLYMKDSSIQYARSPIHKVFVFASADNSAILKGQEKQKYLPVSGQSAEEFRALLYRWNGLDWQSQKFLPFGMQNKGQSFAKCVLGRKVQKGLIDGFISLYCFW